MLSWLIKIMYLKFVKLNFKSGEKILEQVRGLKKKSIKLRFSENATKFEKIIHLDFTFTK